MLVYVEKDYLCGDVVFLFLLRGRRTVLRIIIVEIYVTFSGRVSSRADGITLKHSSAGKYKEGKEIPQLLTRVTSRAA